MDMGGTTEYLFGGKATREPFFLVFSTPLSVKERSRALQEITDGKTPLHLQGRGYTGVTASATEFGTIHGIPFKRLHWSGIESGTGRVQGFIYFGVSGGTLLQLQASGPGKNALNLAEASVLTLQPK